MVEISIEARCSVENSDTVNDLPNDIEMLDISADKSCMAIIYKTTSKTDENAEEGAERYMLTLYNLPPGDNIKAPKRNMDFMEVDVTFIKSSINPNYVFLSASGKSGYVALSFVEMGDAGRLTNPSDNFSNCMIYGNEKTIKKIPFQGRAVFLENRLALVGLDTLVVYKYTEKNDLKKEYTLDTQVLSDGYEATKHQTEIIDDIPWARFVPVETKNVTPIAGQDIITMSRHISNNVLVTQYGSKDGNIVRIWSIFDGTLLTSYKSQHVEHVMAISDNYRYIATYDDNDKVARIYCTKTCMKLHTIPINNTPVDTTSTNTQPNANSRILTMSYMRFFGNGRYIIISGFIPDETNPQTHRLYTFEVWCIPAHKLLSTDNIPVYWKPNLIPFAMEVPNKHSTIHRQSSGNLLNEHRNKVKVTKYGRQHNLPEMKAIFTSQLNQTTKIDTKSLFKQEWDTAIEDVSERWETKGSNGEKAAYKITYLNKRILNLKKRSELNDSLDQYKDLYCFSIVNNTDNFILRFGLYTIQLWRLKELLPSVTESDRKEIGFQLEKREGQPYFYKSMEENELVYIRTYKANDYGPGFTFKEDWNICLHARTPDILFMNSIGHMFVKIEMKYDYSKNKQGQPSDQDSREFINFFQRKWPFNKMIDTDNAQKISNHIIDTDEIFLPLSNLSGFSSNRSSTTDVGPNSINSDFHEIESACRALHHVNNKEEKNPNKPELSKASLTLMNDKIHGLIRRLLDMNKTVKFFTTVSGSRTLAMLASFPIGRDVLKYIITKSRIPISVFSYAKDKNVQESMLTALIDENEDDLFNLFFNRVLIDSLEAGPGNLSAVVDSLLYLQDQGISEILLNCSKKLSYIPVRLDRHPILGSEYNAKIKMKSLRQDYIPSLRTLESCSALEQINKYDDTMRDHFLFWYAKLKRTGFVKLINAAPATFYWFMFGESRTITTLAKLCVVPLPRFNDYKVQPEENIYNEDEKVNNDIINRTFSRESSRISDSPNNNNNNGNNGSSNKFASIMEEKNAFEKIEYRTFSPFTSTAANGNENQIFKQGDTVMEVLTQYKWKTFVKKKFYLILFIHAVYYISYSTAVSFPQELYGYQPGDKIVHPGHYASIVLMFLSSFILLVQELRQFLYKKWDYLTSFYNWIDIAAFTLPVATFALLITGSEYRLDVDSVAVLILWVHAILRLRVFCQFGKLLEIIIQLSGKIMPIIGIMVLVVCAFTHAFIIRLRLADDVFFQEQYQGGASDDDGNLLNGTTLYTINDISSGNNFSDIFRAFTMVWFFIYGVFDPINSGPVGDDTMTIILAFVFSFVTVLIFSNMVIALMSSTVEDVKKRGNKAWISHFAAVVAEVEMLWCTPRERYDRKNNPSYIYYVANVKTVRNQIELIREESKKLIEELNDTDD